MYRYDDFNAPCVFNLKSSNSYRHLTLTHKKENLVRDIDVEDMFYVVEYEYTETKELSSSELLQEDYKKYSGMFPITERIKEQLIRSLYVKLSKNSKDYGEPDITYQLAGSDKLGIEGNTLPDVFYIENK